MKKILVFLFALKVLWFMLATLSSCSKDKTENPASVFCDTTQTYNYTLHVKPILDNSCAFSGCHNTAGAVSGVVLDNYIDAKTATENGRVICAMKYVSGCYSMPPSGKLTDSLIRIVECWANTGFSN